MRVYNVAYDEQITLNQLQPHLQNHRIGIKIGVQTKTKADVRHSWRDIRFILGIAIEEGLQKIHACSFNKFISLIGFEII